MNDQHRVYFSLGLFELVSAVVEVWSLNQPHCSLSSVTSVEGNKHFLDRVFR